MATVTKTYVPVAVDYDRTTHSDATSIPLSNAMWEGSLSYTGAQYSSYLYSNYQYWYKFDVNDIPKLAKNIVVSCSVFIKCTQTTANTVVTLQLYSGNDGKGSPTTFADKTSNTRYDLTCGTWTADELKNAELRIYSTRDTDKAGFLRHYGALLTVTYDEPENVVRAYEYSNFSKSTSIDGISNYFGIKENFTPIKSGEYYYETEIHSGETSTVYFKTDSPDLSFINHEDLGIINSQLVQQSYVPQCIVLHPIAMTYSNAEVKNANNGCTPSTSTTYAELVHTAATATTVIGMYYSFDTSSIPRNAIIDKVECFVRGVKASTSNVAGALLYTNRVNGVSIGTRTDMATHSLGNAYSCRCGNSWTREQLDHLELGVCGSGATGTNNYLFRFYGADLKITYRVPGNYYSYDFGITNPNNASIEVSINDRVSNKANNEWKTVRRAYKKVNDVWEPIPNFDTELQDKVLVGDKYLEMPFSVEAKESGAVSWSLGGKTVQYSKNDGEWTTMTSGTSISASNGDIIRFKGTNGEYNGNILSCTGNFDVYGNIMSLIYGDDFVDEKTLVSANTFYKLFSGDTKLVSAKNLRLPATTLADYCYSYMFSDCTSLTTAPELPATTLADYCYYYMFEGCTSLTTAPELPATTLASNCYNNMFLGCISLTGAPELPATTLAAGCYNGMFQDCTGITSAPELPATTLVSNCYRAMFQGCTGLTTAPALPATTLDNYCYENMFSDCTSLTQAPALPATTLADYCYRYMFRGCTNLKYAPALPATALARGCYHSMFYGCTSLTNAPVLLATTLANNCYFAMFYDCTSLTYIKAMFTTTPGANYTQGWVSGVAASGTFVKNEAATWTATGTSAVPAGWTTRTENQ